MSDREDSFDFEDWKELRKQSQKKRERNRNHGTQLLMNRGIDFESKNNGAHLILNVNGNRIDYYPGTGLYEIFSTKKKGRGIRNLIRLINSMK